MKEKYLTFSIPARMYVHTLANVLLYVKIFYLMASVHRSLAVMQLYYILCISSCLSLSILKGLNVGIKMSMCYVGMCR